MKIYTKLKYFLGNCLIGYYIIFPVISYKPAKSGKSVRFFFICRAERNIYCYFNSILASKTIIGLELCLITWICMLNFAMQITNFHQNLKFLRTTLLKCVSCEVCEMTVMIVLNIIKQFNLFNP